MKKLFLIMMLLLAGCGGELDMFPTAGDVIVHRYDDAGVLRWEHLPRYIYVADPELKEATLAAVEELNAVLGEVFTVKEYDFATTQIQCQDDMYFLGTATVSAFQDALIADCTIKIHCKETTHKNIIAHELFHCLGLYCHYDNPDCLNHSMANMERSIEDMVCDEMREDFNERYSEEVSG